MKRSLRIPAVLIISLFVVAGLAYPGAATDSEAPEPDGDFVFELRDVRIQKTQITGRFVFMDSPEKYFELDEKSMVISADLAKDLWATEIDSRKAEIYSFGCLTWVGLNGEIGFYSSEAVRPDSFILQSRSSTMSRRVFKRVIDENYIPLEDVMAFNPANVSGYSSVEAKTMFPNMGSRIYQLELEKIIGEDLYVNRDEIGALRATFLYQGYVFWYFPERSYDLLPATRVFSRLAE